MSTILIYEDNEGFNQEYALVQPIQAVALCFAFAKILYDNGQIKPVAVSSANQHADIGTN